MRYKPISSKELESSQDGVLVRDANGLRYSDFPIKKSRDNDGRIRGVRGRVYCPLCRAEGGKEGRVVLLVYLPRDRDDLMVRVFLKDHTIFERTLDDVANGALLLRPHCDVHGDVEPQCSITDLVSATRRKGTFTL